MNITNIGFDTYEVQYDIKNIKKAYTLQKDLMHRLPNCNLTIEDLKTLKENSKKFKNISKSLIKGNNITEKEYDIKLKTLIAINSESQNILYHKKYHHNISVIILKDCYNKVDKYINSYQSAEKLFYKYFIVTLIAISILSYLIYNTTTANNLLLYRLIPILTLVPIINLIFFNKTSSNLKRLHTKYTYYANTHKGYTKLIKLKSIIKFCISHIK